jgi:hypothetical protein
MSENRDGKTVKFRVGRPVQHENVQYGIGEYMVTPAVADALKRKNAGAAVDVHMAAAKSGGTGSASDAGSTAEFGGKPDAVQKFNDPNPQNPLQSGSGLNPAATSDQGGINPAATGEGGTGSPSGINPAATSEVEKLSGDLPSDFPQFDKLVSANVTRYEQLTALSSAQLTALGVDEAGVGELSTRLYEDAQKQTPTS